MRELHKKVKFVPLGKAIESLSLSFPTLFRSLRMYSNAIDYFQKQFAEFDKMSFRQIVLRKHFFSLSKAIIPALCCCKKTRLSFLFFNSFFRVGSSFREKIRFILLSAASADCARNQKIKTKTKKELVELVHDLFTDN